MPYICLMTEGKSNLRRLIEKAQQNSFNVVAVPINCMELPLEFEKKGISDNVAHRTYPDLLFHADQWNRQTILILSDDIDCDSPDKKVRQASEVALKRDISWAEHLQYAGYMMLRLRSGRNHNLARLITNIKGLLVVQVPLYNAAVAQTVWRRDLGGKNRGDAINGSTDEDAHLESLQDNANDSWHWWNRFRLASDFNPKMKLALELNEMEKPSMETISRWLGEPLEAIIIPISLFILNSYKKPTIPKDWERILGYFFSAHVNIIVAANSETIDLKTYTEVLITLRERYNDKHDLQSFEDCLEMPLQPLYDNLDCYTYEIFEKDPVKYKLYQKAINEALKDRVLENELETKLTVIMVLGAGRGPLVRSALNAAEETKRLVRIYIIEKNPNAIRTLTNMTKKLWPNKDIHIFSKDMREFQPPEKADILVSELLGSFGDNELSPECLDCAQLLLKPGGISIPYKSTSYINPIMSSKLFNNVRHAVRHEEFTRDRSVQRSYAECGYVVLLKNIYNIGVPQPLFEFVHPNLDVPIDNSRYKVLRFDVTQDCVLNGIAGYFDSALYKDIIISINPTNHTPGMFSWFPMYFPFNEAFSLKAGQVVEIHFWRCISKQKIWYEWCLAEPVTSHIHNQDGRSWPIYSS